MRDFAQNYTPRAFIKYRTLGLVHTLAARLPRNSSQIELQGLVNKLGAVLSAVPGFFYNDWTALSAGWIQQDTGLSFPLVVPAITQGTLDAGLQLTYSKYVHCRFEARSLSGLRTNFTLFGCNVNFATGSQQDMRVSSIENSFPTALWTGLSEVAPSMVAIDGSEVIWAPYFNIKLSDHYLKQLRG